MDSDFWKPILAGQIRHGLTVLAGVAVGAGAIQSSQTAQFVSIGSGIVLWAITAGWSWYQKVRTQPAAKK